VVSAADPLRVKKYEIICKENVNRTNGCRFEAFTALTMKNAFFWVIKIHFVPHGEHITSPLQNPAY
jgi:hypothetical protein